MKKWISPEGFFILTLLLFAAGLRIFGITWGQPDPAYAPSLHSKMMIHHQTPMQPDEFEFVAIPYEMTLKRRFRLPHINRGLASSLNFATFMLTGATEGARIEDRGVNLREWAPFHVYIIARVYTLLGGVICVAATYALARMLFGTFAAAAAGLLTAASFPLVQHAHYSTPSVVAAGMTMLTIWAAYACLKAKKPARLFIISGIAAGLAGASRYNAASIAIVVFFVGLVLLHRHRSREMLKIVLAGWFAVPLAFMITTPQFVVDFQEFWADFVFVVEEYTGDSFITNVTTSWHGMLLEYRHLFLFGLGVPASLFILPGLFAAWQSSRTAIRREGLLRAATPFLLILMLLIHLAAYSYVVLRTIRPDGADQLLIPIIPIFALFIGAGAAFFYNRLPLTKILLAPVLIGIISIIPLVLSVQIIRQMTQPDTRQIILPWIADMLPEGSSVHLNGSYNVPLDEGLYRVTQSFGDQFPTPEELRSRGVEYVIHSDARTHSLLRYHEVLSAEFLQGLNMYLGNFEREAQRIGWIDRPQWTGYDWMMHTASYWHNPGIQVYCLTQTACEQLK